MNGRNREVWVLEDAKETRGRIKRLIEDGLTGVVVRFFDDRAVIESAWQKEQRPSAIVLDLLVPDKRSLVKPLLVRDWTKYLLRKFVLPLIRDKEWLIGRRDRFWGGVEFIRSRIHSADLSVPVYVYSIAMNEEYGRLDPPFGEIAATIRQYIRNVLLPVLATAQIHFFSKGFRADRNSPLLVNDEFNRLLYQLKADLQIA